MIRKDQIKIRKEPTFVVEQGPWLWSSAELPCFSSGGAVYAHCFLLVSFYLSCYTRALPMSHCDVLGSRRRAVTSVFWIREGSVRTKQVRKGCGE